MSGSGLPDISPAQRRILLVMTREILVSALLCPPGSQGGSEARTDLRRHAGHPEVSKLLALHCGLFVTLRRRDRGGELRGCIGRMTSDEPLRTSLPEVAVDTAVRDRRFPPVSAAELPSIGIELSLLSPMTRAAGGWRDIELGIHGIHLSHGLHRAVFLPEVATDQGWDLETTLTRLALKGGMAPGAWKDPMAEILLFTSTHFGEDD
jgi:AmmeMemoRadiSam system protein A